MGIAHPAGQELVACRYLQTTGVMVVDVDIGHNLSWITTDTFDRLWEIVIGCIRNQSVLMTMFNCLPEILPVAARPQDPLVAAGLNLFDELHDFRNVFPDIWELVPDNGSVEIDGVFDNTPLFWFLLFCHFSTYYLWGTNYHKHEFYRDNDL